MDQNSAFRKYYINDNLFYETVMKKEDPPYEFKIHLFLDNKSQKRDDEKEGATLSHREINLQVMKKLTEFGAINIKDTPMNQGRDKGEKIRYLFDIPDRDQALACFRFFNDYYDKVRQNRGGNYKKDEKSKDSQAEKGADGGDDGASEFNLTELMKIYLQKEEHVFVKHADDEAEIYEQMQKMERE